jgi:alkylated DNA repair dioxygenase AlkB
MKSQYIGGEMKLFEDKIDADKNLLPKDGIVQYHGKFMSEERASAYLQTLLQTIEWKNEEITLYGKRIVTKRKVAWYGDAAYTYTYSKNTKRALFFTPELLDLKKLVEATSNETYNSCLLNLYHTGEEGMGWHSDAEKELKQNGAICSLSLGAERIFSFKHKTTKEIVSIMLEHGSLLVMKGTVQTHWLHQLPVRKSIRQLRINLTFRTVVGS